MKKLFLSMFAVALTALQAQAVEKRTFDVDGGFLKVKRDYLYDSKDLKNLAYRFRQTGTITGYSTERSHTPPPLGQIRYKIPKNNNELGKKECSMKLYLNLFSPHIPNDQAIAKAMMNQAFIDMRDGGCDTIISKPNANRILKARYADHLALLKNEGFVTKQPSLFKKVMQSVGLAKGTVNLKYTFKK